jgi:predicted metal-dependent phosphoesterase TrpH
VSLAAAHHAPQLSVINARGRHVTVVELHSHSSASYDSRLKPADIVRACREKGIDKLALTDHHSIRGALELQTLAPELVIVGEEILTTCGELLAYFVEEEVPRGLPPHETIARLKAQGAVISVPHPFDRWRSGAWREADLIAILPHVDAIEVFNSRIIFQADNARALAFAQQHDKLCTVGSDAHYRRELGRAVVMMPHAPDTPAELRAGLAQAEFLCHSSSPFIHSFNMLAWTKREITRAAARK